MKKIFLSIITLCLGGVLIFSCKDDDSITQQCKEDFVLENDSCVCPIGKYLVMDGNSCTDLRNNQWAAEVSSDNFWANLIIVNFPAASEHYPVGTSIITDQHFGGNITVGYYQYPLENGVDSFELSFMTFSGAIDSSLCFSENPEGYYWIVGKKQGNDSIFDARLQTRKEYGVVTSSTPLHFHK